MTSYLYLLDEYVLNDILKMARIMYINECHNKHNYFFSRSHNLRKLYWATGHILDGEQTYDKIHKGSEYCDCGCRLIVREINHEADKRETFINDYLSALKIGSSKMVYLIYKQKSENPKLFEGSILSYILMYKQLK